MSKESGVLIDTDVAIDFLRGEKSAQRLIEPLWRGELAYLSLLSIYELRAGMREIESRYTMDFIHACQITALTVAIVSEAGDYYRFHRARGMTLTSIDCMIYMTAKQNNFKLLTHNIKHYPDKDILVKHTHH